MPNARSPALIILHAAVCATLALAGLTTPAAHAATKLAEDCRTDQTDREGYKPHADTGGNDLAWDKIAKRDVQRRQRVLDAVKQHRLRSAEDYRCAALILLHAGDEPNLRLSYALAVQGQSVYPGHAALVRLSANAWDRLMMARQQPQWFATQFQAKQGSSEFQLYPVAASVMTEDERSRLGGLTSAEVSAKLAALNAQKRPAGTADAAPVGRRYRLVAAKELLLSSLDLDVGLANALAQAKQEGLLFTAASSGEAVARLIYLGRASAPIQAFFTDEVARIPKAEGSATPTSASVADVQIKREPDGQHRLVLGIDDDVQAAATLVVKPSRFFELLVETNELEGTLTLKSFKRLR
jgi:hypothetical protein